jgi:hypothetical protein
MLMLPDTTPHLVSAKINHPWPLSKPFLQANLPTSNPSAILCILSPGTPVGISPLSALSWLAAFLIVCRTSVFNLLLTRD